MRCSNAGIAAASKQGNLSKFTLLKKISSNVPARVIVTASQVVSSETFMRSVGSISACLYAHSILEHTDFIVMMDNEAEYIVTRSLS